MFTRTLFSSALMLLMASVASATPPAVKTAQPTPTREDKDFKRRFTALRDAKKMNLIRIKMKPSEDPGKVPQIQGGGPTLVSGNRMGIYTPPVLSSEDILSVVNRKMVDIRRCYKKQLKTDPEWADDLILDLAIKKNGRVNEVSVAPGRVRKDVIGRCLMRTVPRWRFPRFTGELDEGVSQEVINTSLPFSFSSN